MNTFSIDTFAAQTKAAMAASTNRAEAARQMLTSALEQHGAEDIYSALEAAVPEGADIGELIVFADDELTMLFARLPARFQSGIHDHTVFAAIGQLRGAEISTTYAPDGDGLRPDQVVRTEPGDVAILPADVVHAIENPANQGSASLHLYGGNLPGLAAERTLWDSKDHQPEPFTFPALLKQSVKAMRASANQDGIDALVKAIPAAAPLVDASA